MSTYGAWWAESTDQKIDHTGIPTMWTVRGRQLPNTSNNSMRVVNFFDQRFQSTKTLVFVRKHFKQLLNLLHISYFLAKI